MKETKFLAVSMMILSVSCQSLVPVSKADAVKGKSVIPVPPGYREIFRSDFSATTLTAGTFSGDQWWYRMSGGEYGYNWASCQELTGSADRGPRVQTLVGAASDLEKYMKSRIDEDGSQGKVLKFTNYSDDPDYRDLSRNQVLCGLDRRINKLFYEFKYKFPKETADSLKARSGKWWDFTEFHNNVAHDGHSYRLSFYIQADGSSTLPDGKPASGYYFRARLYDDTSRKTIWAVDTPIEKVWPANTLKQAWDEWHTVNVHVEAKGNGPEDGLIKAWVDGYNICDRTNSPLGWPWENLHIFKGYISSAAMTGVPLNFYVDDIRIYKGE